MSWQLWVLVALAAAGLLLLVVLRMRRARTVFDDITRLDQPARSEMTQASADDLARARARRVHPEPDRHRRHG